MRHRTFIVCACFLAVACSSWDRDSNGGGSNLPNRGVIPWQVDMEPIPERDAGRSRRYGTRRMEAARARARSLRR